MKAALLFLITVHGLAHLPGFAKAFSPAAVGGLHQPVSKAGGLLWLASAILFIATAIVLFLKKEAWWMPAAVGIVLSQCLIFTSWPDAKWGTVANGIILLAVVVGWASWHFGHAYRQEVKAGLQQAATAAPEPLLTETDLRHLPPPVQKYLHYAGAVGRPKVKNFRVAFSGQIRKNDRSAWMPFTSVQYNFVDASLRLFFMKATMGHLPVAGFHCFKAGKAFMDIRLASLFKVQYQRGREMDTAETVTFFNDMCCMAPATLIDKRINWLATDGNRVKAAFTANNITITAWLYFNEQGGLVNFVSDDRYAAGENGTMKRLRWSTPLKDYTAFGGHRLAGYADAVYSYPEGDFCYGQFRLAGIEYNCKSFK